MEKCFSESVVAPFSEVYLLVCVEPFPFFLDCIDVEDSFLLAVLYDFRGGSSDGEVDTKTNFVYEHFVKDLLEVLSGEPNFHEFDFRVLIGEVDRIRVNDSHLIKFEMSLDERDCSSTYRTVSDHTDIVDFAVKGELFSLHSLLLYHSRKH